MLTIRKATVNDIPRLVEIYNAARQFMWKSGNTTQWSPDYPSAETAANDIARGGSYVVVDDANPDRALATFFFIIGQEPTYQVIENGQWLDDETYGVIHRAASDGSVKGVTRLMLDFCFNLCSNIRADTHRDNMVVQRNLTNYGFKYCGIIHVANGSERLAHQLHR